MAWKWLVVCVFCSAGRFRIVCAPSLARHDELFGWGEWCVRMASLPVRVSRWRYFSKLVVALCVVMRLRSAKFVGAWAPRILAHESRAM